jgi:hypothetical protein
MIEGNDRRAASRFVCPGGTSVRIGRSAGAVKFRLITQEGQRFGNICKFSDLPDPGVLSNITRVAR